MNFTKDNPVYIKVRECIISGRWRPGHVLRPGELANELRVSVSPVREALIRLSARGLIVSAEKAGFSIPEYDLTATCYYCDLLTELYKESIRNINQAGVLAEVATRFNREVSVISDHDSPVLKRVRLINACRSLLLSKPYLALISNIGDLVLAHQAVVTTKYDDEYGISEALAFVQCLSAGDLRRIEVAIEQHFAQCLASVKTGTSQLMGLPYGLAFA